MQIDLKSNLDRLQYKIDHESKVNIKKLTFCFLPASFQIINCSFFLFYFPLRSTTTWSINFKSYKLSCTTCKIWMISIRQRLFGKWNGCAGTCSKEYNTLVEHCEWRKACYGQLIGSILLRFVYWRFKKVLGRE